MDVMWNTLWVCYILLHGFVFGFVASSMQNGLKNYIWRRDFSMEKLKPTGVVSFATSTSQLHCSVQCSLDKPCIIFSFNKERKLCRGYSAVDRAKGVHKYPTTIEPKIYSYRLDFYSRLTVYTIKRNFQGAATICAKAGGHLLVMDTPAKVDYILRRKGVSNVWIGLTDQQTEGKWLWANGKSFGPDQKSQLNAAFNNFDGTQTGSRRKNADCAVMRLNSGFVYDVHCSKAYNFICEAY